MNFIRIYFLIGLASFLSVHHLQGQGHLSDPTTIKLVSLQNGNDSVRIEWILSNNTKVVRYIIYSRDHYDLNAWDSISTSVGAANNSYTFKYSPASKDSVSFRMRSVDSANIKYALGNIHTSNYLKLSPDTCNYTFHLKWSGYKGWGDSILKYQVIIKEGSLPERVFYTEHIPGNDSIDYPFPISDSLYCFVVKAIKNDGLMSYSNQDTIFLHIPKIPLFINADYASINTSGTIDLSFSLDPSTELKTYALMRAESETGPFSLIHSFSATKPASIRFTDSQADPLVHHYYKLVAQNSCNSSMKESNLAGNIVPQASETGNEVLLNWNKYRWWTGGAGADSLMRSNPAGGWEFVASISPSDSTYTDSLDLLAYHNYMDKICYYVKASQGSLNPSGTKSFSLSNVVCVDVPSVIKIPNAFTPNGDLKNDEFTISFEFIPSEYLLKVFDRNGNILFQTSDPSHSWDGTDAKGRKVIQGTYVYYIRYTIQGHPARELRGTISVLYP
jgi:gliding motility-associated-like protein